MTVDGQGKSLLREIYGELRTAVGKIRQSHPAQLPCLFLEDLALVLDLGFPVNEVLQLIISLKSLVKDGILVIYATCGKDDGVDVILRNFLFHYANWFLETSGLSSGLSSAIDGQVGCFTLRKIAKKCSTEVTNSCYLKPFHIILVVHRYPKIRRAFEAASKDLPLQDPR